MNEVLLEVSRERAAQDEKWGEQNHPDGTHKDLASMANLRRNQCDRAAAEGCVTFRHILAEEVAEAFAEEDSESLRAELIQVAAVAVSWIESIDRRNKGPQP